MAPHSSLEAWHGVNGLMIRDKSVSILSLRDTVLSNVTYLHNVNSYLDFTHRQIFQKTVWWNIAISYLYEGDDYSY